MKRFYTTFALLGALISTSFAQRHCDVELVAAAPATNTVINCTDSFTLAYIFVNNGPDMLMTSDTMFVIDGEIGDGSVWNYSLENNAAVGDTVIFYAAKSHKNMTQRLVNSAGDAYVFAPFANGSYKYPILFVGFSDTTAVVDTGLSNDGALIDVTYNCSATGINNVAFANESLQLFPNPTNALVNFNYNFAERSAIANIKVTDISGRTVLSAAYGEQRVGNKQFSLDLSSLNSGMYYVELVTDSKRAISKVTVQK